MSEEEARRLSLSAQEEESSERQQQTSPTDHGRVSHEEADSGEESSSRAPNFTDEETDTLINQVVHHSFQLFGSPARNVHHRFKGTTWNEISESVSLGGGFKRSNESCKKRLRDCRRSVNLKIQKGQKLHKDWEKKMENYFVLVQEEMAGTSAEGATKYSTPTKHSTPQTETTPKKKTKSQKDSTVKAKRRVSFGYPTTGGGAEDTETQIQHTILPIDSTLQAATLQAESAQMHPPTVQEETSSQQPLPEENSSQGHPQTLPEESFSQSYPAIGDHNLVERTEQIPDMETSGSVPEVLESKTPETTPGESSLNLILEALKNMDQCRAEESQRINNRLDNMEQNIDHIKTAVVQQNDAMISLARYYDQLVSAHMSVVGHCKSMEQKIEQISTQQNEQRDGESHQEQLCRQHNDSLEHISLQCQQIGTGLQSMLLWQQQCNLNTSMISTSLQLMTDEGRRLHSAQPQQAERSSEVTTPSNRTSIDQEMYAQEERGDLAYQRALSVLRLQRQRSEELEQSIIQQEMWNRAQQEMLEQAQTVMWNRAQEEHARAQEEHARAQEEHARAQEEHARAQDEHATAPEEHATAPEEPSGSQEEPSTTAN
ncbi:uncharacterized protein LOC135054520 [Pseudophryne corroboree]|uniref:uncharacterized protein LOC134911175 n=1 Tax=Pseudophryne corroboree TaxID=495146 RepID=UPI0030815AEB